MNSPFKVGLFAEDRAHEVFVQSVVERLCGEAGVEVVTQIIVARGGHGRVMTEYAVYQKSYLSRPSDIGLHLVTIDANCEGWSKMRKQVEDKIDPALRPYTIVACPDPHIERWFLADPRSLSSCLGVTVPTERRKCERNRYKNLLRTSLLDAGHIVTLGGLEFASDIVNAMNLYRAGKNEPSLRHMLDGLSAKIKDVASQRHR